jgi:hypothetical protein
LKAPQVSLQIRVCPPTGFGKYLFDDPFKATSMHFFDEGIKSGGRWAAIEQHQSWFSRAKDNILASGGGKCSSSDDGKRSPYKPSHSFYVRAEYHR